MRDENFNGYTITWTQGYQAWHPMISFRDGVEQPDPEITDFTEANQVLAKIMAK